MALLGLLTAHGIGTTKNLTKARRLLTRANKDGDYPEAASALQDLETVTVLGVVRSPPWRRRPSALHDSDSKRLGRSRIA